MGMQVGIASKGRSGTLIGYASNCNFAADYAYVFRILFRAKLSVLEQDLEMVSKNGYA